MKRFLSQCLMYFVGTIAITSVYPYQSDSVQAQVYQCNPLPASSRMAIAATNTGTIVDIAGSNRSFSTLVAAVKAADLVEVLSGQGPYTVFAPTDAAFANLPPGTVDKLLRPENRAVLRKILTYHVLPKSLDSKAIRPGRVITVEGSPITLRIRRGKLTVNNSTVTQADIQASNGIIHAIDQVLIPPDVTLR